jgi:hypothetical protein
MLATSSRFGRDWIDLHWLEINYHQRGVLRREQMISEWIANGFERCHEFFP